MRSFPPKVVSLSDQLSLSLFILAILSLVVTGGGLIYLSFEVQLHQLENVQRNRSRAASVEINAYFDDLQRKLGYLARVRGLTDFPPGEQQALLEGLARHNSAYEMLAILDRKGRIASSVSLDVRTHPLAMAHSPSYLRSFRQEEDYASPVAADPATRLPTFTLSVPVRDRQDRVDGVLLARVNLNFLWFIVSQVDAGQTGYAYVIDDRDVLIAKKGDTPETFRLVDVADRPFIRALTAGTADPLKPYRGLNGAEVLGAIAPIPILRWNVVVELPTNEAFAPIRAMLAIMGLALAAATLAAAALSRFFSRQINEPLQRLTQAAVKITAGETAVRVEVSGPNELGLLATAFNDMTDRLQDMIASLEQRVKERTNQLEAANKELEAFSYSVSHDLRAPLRSVDAFSLMLLEGYADKLDAKGLDFLQRVRKASQRMAHLIDDLLQLSRVARAEMRRATVDMSELARSVLLEYQQSQPERQVEVAIAPGLKAHGDLDLLRVVLDNLLGNAWKYTSKRERARIEFGASGHHGEQVFFVKDNGAGFDMTYADRLFTAFQRLHTAEEFPGTGIGLATVYRIVQRHGGRVWAEAAVDRGATFYFTMGETETA